MLVLPLQNIIFTLVMRCDLCQFLLICDFVLSMYIFYFLASNFNSSSIDVNGCLCLLICVCMCRYCCLFFLSICALFAKSHCNCCFIGTQTILLKDFSRNLASLMLNAVMYLATHKWNACFFWLIQSHPNAWSLCSSRACWWGHYITILCVTWNTLISVSNFLVCRHNAHKQILLC